MSKQPSRIKNKAGILTVIGALAIGAVGAFEGLRTRAYLDIVGVPTVCYGETRGVSLGDQYTVEECKAMLGDGLLEFEQGMLKCIIDPASVPDKSYVAFLSFSYNVGTGAFCKSTLVRKLNSGNLLGACDELLKWVNAGGKVVQGLVNRRNEERALCLEGLAEGPPTIVVAPAPPVSIEPVSALPVVAEPEPEAPGIDWRIVALVALAVLAIGAAVIGFVYVRRKRGRP